MTDTESRCPWERCGASTVWAPSTGANKGKLVPHDFCERHYRVKDHPGMYRRIRGGKTIYEAHGRDRTGRAVAKTGATIEEAETALRTAVGYKGSPKDQRLDATAGKITLSDYFETRYMANKIKMRKLKPKAELGYRGDFKLHIEPTFGEWPLQRIKRAAYNDWRADLWAKGLASTSLKRIEARFHGIMEEAFKEELIPGNPVITGGYEDTDKTFVFLDTEQTWQLAMAMQPRNYGALVLTMYATGIRVGEASALRVMNLDLEALTLKVEENAVLVNGKRVLGTPKTKGSRRTIHLHPSLAPILRTHIESFSDPNDPQAWVFTNQRGHPFRADDFGRALRVAAKVAGVPAPKPKDFRDMQTRILEEQGASEREKAAVLGHTRLATTEIYGGKADPARLRALANAQDVPAALPA